MILYHIYYHVYNIMPDAQLQNKIFTLTNKAFLVLNSCLTLLCLILSLCLSHNLCLSFTLQLYQLLYLSQTVQHTLLDKFPHIDINKHHTAYRRTVIGICLVDVGYMFMCVTFWQKSEYHPVYCLVCEQWGWGLWVGLGFVLHEVVLIGWAATLINGYVRRRYYLLALGGFEVEQRILQQRAQQLQQMLIIEPDTNPYPLPVPMPHSDKYYQFEDIPQTEQQNSICTICLNQRIEDDHFVNAGCGHYFHNVCLIQWAQVNQNCPQCRQGLRGREVIQEAQEKQEQDCEEEGDNGEEGLERVEIEGDIDKKMLDKRQQSISSTPMTQATQ